MKPYNTCLRLTPAVLVMAVTAGNVSGQSAAGGTTNILTDGQVLQIVRTLNDGEIKQAGEALDESRYSDVRELAQTIDTDHRQANDDIDKLLDGPLDLDDSALSEKLASEAEKTHERLQDLSGAQYDCAYLQAQVMQHEEAIDISKTQLMVSAKDSGVRQLLTAIGPKLEHHLEMANNTLDKTSCD